MCQAQGLCLLLLALLWLVADLCCALCSWLKPDFGLGPEPEALAELDGPASLWTITANMETWKRFSTCCTRVEQRKHYSDVLHWAEAGFQVNQTIITHFYFIFTSLIPVMTVIMILLLHIFTTLLLIITYSNTCYYIIITCYYCNSGSLSPLLQ